MVGQATSATIIPSTASGRRSGNAPLGTFIPLQNPTSGQDDSMSLIVQLGTTVVSKGPSTSITNTCVTGGRNVTYRDSRINVQSDVPGPQPAHPQQQSPRPYPNSLKTLLPSGLSGGPKVIPSHRGVQQMMSPAKAAMSHQKPGNFEVHKLNVPATPKGRHSSESNKESPVERQISQIGEEKKPGYNSTIPLMYQYVLQEHNYVAPPPVSPPLSPLLHHQLGTKLNGAPSSGSPSSLGSEHLSTVGKNVGLLTMRPTNHISNSQMNEDAGSDLSSEGGRDAEVEGEETDTALEGEGDEDSITRCIWQDLSLILVQPSGTTTFVTTRLVNPRVQPSSGEYLRNLANTRMEKNKGDFEHDDGYMICCDKCSVWQHVDCMGIDRGNIPEEYMCERCQPRWVDKLRARSIQMRKKEEFFSNDTSSDSSSTSTDSEPMTTKKRGPVSGGRRKGEPMRKSAGLGCGPVPHTLSRQRRESAREPMMAISGPNRRQQTPRKKSIDNKRQPRRRKSKGTEDEKSPDVWDKSPPLQSLRTWIDHYEEAVTNHYSPELRARIQSIRMNGVYSEVKPPLHLLSTTSGSTKCRVTLLPNGTKILVASCVLAPNQPLIELRGKYMLSSNNKLGGSVQNRGVPAPGPYMFYHKLPLNAQRDYTEVCVDCRTYGNDARFVRRSCRPNSEIRHCVEKGILHLFLVTLCNVDKNSEITIRHQEGSNMPCVCGSKDCLVALQSNGRRNGAVDSNEPVRRRRGRRRTVSTTENKDLHSPTGAGRSPSPNNMLPSPVANGASSSPFPAQPSPVAQTLVSERRTRNSLSPLAQPEEEPPKTEPKEEVKEEPEDAKEDENLEDVKMKEEPEKTKKKIKEEEEVSDESPRQPSPPPPPPMTRNTMARRCSVANRTPQIEAEPAVAASPRRREREKEREKEVPPVERDQKKKEPADKKNKVMTREERKLDAIMKAFERMEKLAEKKREAQTRQARQKSSEKVEENETPARKENTVERTRRRRRKGRGRLNSATQAKEPARPQRRTRLLSRTSEPPDEPASSDDEPTSLHLDMANKTPPQPVDKEQGVPGSGGSSHSSWSQGSTPPTPLSSACLLVAAAVEPLGPGFKFPKTKKGLLSSWFKTPDGASPTTAGTPTLPDMKPLSPDGSSMNAASPGVGSAGFAKKRWLRQAISEECDSPSRPDVDAPNYSAPLKKRRMARESMSIDSSDKVLSLKLDDDDTLQEYESDQPTHDEDTMDGATPGRAVDTETSSHDDASQSAEEAGINPDTRPKIDDMEAAMSAIVGHSATEGPQFPPRTGEEEDVVGALVAAAASVPVPVAALPERPAEPPATRRKLSISEYRQRNQRASTECSVPQNEVNANLADDADQRRGRRRSMSTSSSSSSSLSDEEDRLRSLDTEPIMTKIMALENAAAAATTSVLPPLAKDGDQDNLKGTAWNSAPTLVERQRENLTERLRREFGLFVSDDEEQERARRQSLEAAKDGKKNLLLPPPPPPPSVPPPATPPPPPPPPPPLASDVSNMIPVVGPSIPVPPLSNFSAPFGTYGASAKSTIVPMPGFTSGRPNPFYSSPTGKTFYPNYGRP